MEAEEAVRPCWMEIDLAALAHNTRILRAGLGEGQHICGLIQLSVFSVEGSDDFVVAEAKAGFQFLRAAFR